MGYLKYILGGVALSCLADIYGILDVCRKSLALQESFYNQQKLRKEQQLKMLGAALRHMYKENHQQAETVPEKKVEENK
ncbi:hypothetical protein MKW98_026797 [Papaver atlanticum]|uniref:Uncharacterized protein n=1 Tax=Papaver atlanticum TaxID=357466 RepID=A0AAD4S1H2_9MAGN|nr:hypothetical protein MKW98_026797 [Papaver atlanticum]